MLVQLLCAAKVTDLQSWLLLRMQRSFSIDQNIIRLDVTMSDTFCVNVLETLEKLVAKLPDDC